MRKCIVLFSGGIDSTVAAAMLIKEGYEVFTLAFDYGQRNIGETTAARMLSADLGAKYHEEIHIQGISEKSALMDQTLEVPKGRTIKEIESGIASTYVPARNTIFLSYALGFAEHIDANYIAVGADADESEHNIMPDAEPAYFRAFEKMANIATKSTIEGKQHITILTPVIKMLTYEIILKGVELGINFEITLSCYDPISQVLACGRCDACILRKRGFEQADVKDTTQYGIRK